MSIFAYTQVPNENLESWNLKGPVKMVYHTSHTVKKSFGKIKIEEKLEDLGRSNYLLLFDINNNLTRYLSFRADSNYADIIEYTYVNQNLIKFNWKRKNVSSNFNRESTVV